MNKTAIRKVMMSMVDMPPHKITYVIIHDSYVKGLWDTLARYNIEHTKENHELLVEIVQEKLEGDSDIEHEWTELEYETFVKFTEEKIHG